MQIQPNGGTGAAGSVLKKKKNNKKKESSRRSDSGSGQKNLRSLDAPVAMATAEPLRYLQLAGHYHS